MVDLAQVDVYLAGAVSGASEKVVQYLPKHSMIVRTEPPQEVDFTDDLYTPPVLVLRDVFVLSKAFRELQKRLARYVIDSRIYFLQAVQRHQSNFYSFFLADDVQYQDFSQFQPLVIGDKTLTADGAPIGVGSRPAQPVPTAPVLLGDEELRLGDEPLTL